MKFKPQEINVEGDSETNWSNTVEFWVDRAAFAGTDDALAMYFNWAPDSQWRVCFWTPESKFGCTGERVLINVGGPYRTVRIVRRTGATEWFLDDRLMLTLPDMKETRFVLVRVVGTRADFEYLPT